jgi:hypothetical protein
VDLTDAAPLRHEALVHDGAGQAQEVRALAGERRLFLGVAQELPVASKEEVPVERPTKASHTEGSRRRER